MKSAIAYVRQNWEFAVQGIIVLIYVGLFVADHYGKTNLDSGTIGTTIVGLLFFASLRLTRETEQQKLRLASLRSDHRAILAGIETDLATVRRHQLTAEEIRQVPGDHISEVLNKVLSESDQWHFRGGSARWQLETVLPALADRRDLPSRYVMQIIDPLDPQLTTRYGQYRANSRTRDQAPSLVDGPNQVTRDLLACIYAAGWYQVNSQVRPEVTLLKSYSPLRIDCGSSGLMVTIANKSAPGLFAAKGTWYYRSVLDELEQLEKVSSRLLLPDQLDVYPRTLAEVTESQVRQMLKQVVVKDPDGTETPFGLNVPGNPLAAADYPAIVTRIKAALK